MQIPFAVPFPEDSPATAIYIEQIGELSDAIAQLGLPTQRPVLVIIGGAKFLAAAEFDRLRVLFQESIVPIAEQWNAVVLDGGTQSGVMQLMGESRRDRSAQFPLVGVAPAALVQLPASVSAGRGQGSGSGMTQKDPVQLEPHHTHFILVPGTAWGDESATLAHLAQAIAQGAPIVTLLCNGGEVTWQDAWENVKQRHPLIVLAGTGRAADDIANTLRGLIQNERALALLNLSQVQRSCLQVVDLEAGPLALTQAIATIFS
ncbi:MAG: hypothetical protein VKJ24_19075 [Synechococcales bacterium]|nr:hypothetical protein [Synechococcales bacterium]